SSRLPRGTARLIPSYTNRKGDAESASAPYFCVVHDLFEQQEDADLESADSAAPLATRMRPRSLDEFVGQEHILAPGQLLRRAIEADRLPSSMRSIISTKRNRTSFCPALRPEISGLSARLLTTRSFM